MRDPVTTAQGHWRLNSDTNIMRSHLAKLGQAERRYNLAGFVAGCVGLGLAVMPIAWAGLALVETMQHSFAVM